MLNTWKKAFLFTTGIMVLLFVGTSMYSASASEKISDSQLEQLDGGAKYFTGACSGNAIDAKCKPTPGIVLAPDCGTCTGPHCGTHDTGDRYQDVQYSYRYCVGNNIYDESKATCMRGGGYVYKTLERHIYSLSGLQGCNAEERPASPFRVCDQAYCWDRTNTSSAWQGEPKNP